MASSMDRVSNMLCWLRRFPDWDLDSRGFAGVTALGWACWNGSAEAAQFLSERRANPNVVADHGSTPLLLAVLGGMDPFSGVKVLLDAKADVNFRLAPKTELWKGFCSKAMAEVEQGTAGALSAELAEWLDSTALSVAMRRGDLKSARALLQARADPNVRNRMNHSIWDLARCTFRDAELAEVFSLLEGSRP